MSSFQELKEKLLGEAAKLHARHEFSKTMPPDFFEPGMMEYPEQSEGLWDEAAGKLLLRFESKGTRYDGRTELIENVQQGEGIQIVRDPENEFNANNFRLFTETGKDVGNMPAALCNAIAPLYDEDLFVIDSAKVSFVDPISRRNRHAKQAVLFVEMQGTIIEPDQNQSKSVADNTMGKPDGSAEEDPCALHLDLTRADFYIGAKEIRKDTPYDEIINEVFCKDAKEVVDLKIPGCLHVCLRNVVSFAGEKWVVQLLFDSGKFNTLWLEHAKLFQQRSLIKNASSSPRLRKERSSLYSKLKTKVNELAGKQGEQVSDNGNLQCFYTFEDHAVMLVQDNKLPSIVISIDYSVGDKDLGE